jgi:hypothetical protein
LLFLGRVGDYGSRANRDRSAPDSRDQLISTLLARARPLPNASGQLAPSVAPGAV